MLPRIHITLERWKKNKEYGVYVSTLGRIRLIKNKEFLAPRINLSGYCVVYTEKGAQLVHRLVAITWLGSEYDDRYNVDHIDSNKRNNAVSNLRWVEREINSEYADFTRTEVPAPEKINDYCSQMLNEGLSNDDRGKILLKLFSKNKAQIYYNDVEIKTMLGFSNLKFACGAANASDEHFAGRIIRAFVSNSKYCKYNWKIKINE